MRFCVHFAKYLSCLNKSQRQVVQEKHFDLNINFQKLYYLSDDKKNDSYDHYPELSTADLGDG